jgi:tellurite resistance-related uncharacterized protein
MSLPADVRPYSRTPIFTEGTIPGGLLKAHSTKQDAWALIHVLEGQLSYRIEDSRRPASVAVLTPNSPAGIIEPTILHRVAPLGAVRFYVEFHRAGE